MAQSETGLHSSLRFRGGTGFADYSASAAWNSRQRTGPGVHVLLAPGRRDPIVSHEQIDMLVRMLETAGADISLSWHEGGHELGQDDLIAAKNWLSRQSFTSPDK